MTTDIELNHEAIGDIAELAAGAMAPAELELGKYYAFTVGGQLHKVDLTGDQHRQQPQRKRGRTLVRDVPSFAAYWRKHAADDISEVYADRDSLTVTAVLDAHGEDIPGWAEHRLVLQLQHTNAWHAWANASGREMEQETFANFLEDNRADIMRPAAAEMLEVAQSIQAATKVDFTSAHRLVDGQRRIAYTETVESRAGSKGELAIPAEIELGLFVFKGATVADSVTARFRHRINGGALRLMFKLDRPELVVDAAFSGVVAEVAEQCAATVLAGTPA